MIYPFSRDEGKFPTLRWTRKSTAMLAKEINELELKISKKKTLTVSQKTVNSIMKALGYSILFFWRPLNTTPGESHEILAWFVIYNKFNVLLSVAFGLTD